MLTSGTIGGAAPIYTIYARGGGQLPNPKSAKRGETLTPNPNECNSTLTRDPNECNSDTNPNECSSDNIFWKWQIGKIPHLADLRQHCILPNYQQCNSN